MRSILLIMYPRRGSPLCALLQHLKQPVEAHGCDSAHKQHWERVSKAGLNPTFVAWHGVRPIKANPTHLLKSNTFGLQESHEITSDSFCVGFFSLNDAKKMLYWLAILQPTCTYRQNKSFIKSANLRTSFKIQPWITFVMQDIQDIWIQIF